MDEVADARKAIWNVPNILTIARLVLSVFCFVCFVFEAYLPALVFFVIAAGTDWVDGYWARKYGQVTKLGRILDPFADKIIICGTFIFLAAVPPLATGDSASELTAWMAVVVVARELLVTALRGFFEEHGTDFRRSGLESGRWSRSVRPSRRASRGCGTTATAAASGRLCLEAHDFRRIGRRGRSASWFGLPLE